MTAAAGVAPRVVTRGVKSQTTERAAHSRGRMLDPRRARNAPTEDGVKIGLDWIRTSGPAESRKAAESWMIERFGEDFEVRGGFQHYGERWVWPNGASLFLNHRGDDGCRVEIPGSVLAEHDATERVRWLFELTGERIGHRVTRVDVAIDFVRKYLGLVDHAYDSCKARELVGLRRWEHFENYRGDELIGRTVYMGRRGDRGAGKCVRVYDKGLEQRWEGSGHPWERGEWERWEVEFADDVARQFVEHLRQSELKRWGVAAAEIVIGVAEFREQNGRRDRDRRRYMPWYEQLVAAVGDVVYVVGTPRTIDAARSIIWFRTSVAPLVVSLARRMRRPQEEIWNELVGDVEPGYSKRRDYLIEQFVRLANEDPKPPDREDE